MLIVTTNSVPGRDIGQVFGLVSGAVITSKNVGEDIGAGLKSLVGGELKSYTKMMDEARQEATARMVAEAERVGADAIIATRIQAGQVAGGAAEIYAYGTAVVAVSRGGAEPAHGSSMFTASS